MHKLYQLYQFYNNKSFNMYFACVVLYSVLLIYKEIMVETYLLCQFDIYNINHLPKNGGKIVCSVPLNIWKITFLNITINLKNSITNFYSQFTVGTYSHATILTNSLHLSWLVVDLHLEIFTPNTNFMCELYSLFETVISTQMKR